MVKALPVIALLAVAVSSAAIGQLYEDRLEPDELDIGDIEKLATPAARYLGNDACAQCHPGTYETWLGTKHARAFVSLRSAAAISMGEEVGITGDEPAKSGKCLSCHATGHDVPAGYRDADFRMAEGVVCEACHGPGGTHASAAALALVSRAGLASPPRALVAMVAGLWAHYGIAMPKREQCISCHKQKPSHEPALPFDVETAWPMIEHSERENEEGEE